MFTMTVVCDEASKDTIRNMVFQNINKGFNGIAEMQVKELQDGRLRFYYSVNYDASYVNREEPNKSEEHIWRLTNAYLNDNIWVSICLPY